MLKSQNFKLAELKYKPVARISQKEFNINGVGDNQSGGFGAQLPEHLNLSTAVIGLKLNLCTDVSNELISVHY